MYVCLLQRFACPAIVSATTLGATAKAARCFHTAGIVYEERSKPSAGSLGSSLSNMTPAHSPLRKMFLESAASLQSPYENSKHRRAKILQNSQLEKMKARVASVLKRTEVRRKQSEDAAASRGSSSREKERAPRDEEITAPMINLVLEDGSLDGIHPLSRVLAKMDLNLMTLVMVNPSEDPPVCRIYSRKLLYERERQIKKKQTVSVKNSKPQRIVMTCGIDSHDLEIKLKKAADMLAKGKRVTVVVELREGHTGYDGRKKLGAKVMAELEGKCSVVSPPTIEGRTWMAVLHGKSLS